MFYIVFWVQNFSLGGKNEPHHFNADVEKGDLSVTGPEHL